MFAFHFLPIGKQIIGIEFPQKSDHWVLRDNGSGSENLGSSNFFRIEGGGTRYTDEVYIVLVFSHYQSISTHSFFTPIDKCDGGN